MRAPNDWDLKGVVVVVSGGRCVCAKEKLTRPRERRKNMADITRRDWCVWTSIVVVVQGDMTIQFAINNIDRRSQQQRRSHNGAFIYQENAHRTK